MKKFVKFMVHYLITQIIPIKKSLLESWQQVQGEESSYTQFIFSSTVKDCDRVDGPWHHMEAKSWCDHNSKSHNWDKIGCKHI